MKKIVLCIFLTIAVTGGLLFAQEKRWPGFGSGSGTEKETVSGTLTIAKGQIAVKNGGVTYYLFGLDRFIGFIDGLKEGAQVKLEGSIQKSKIKGAENDAFMMVTTLTLNGKTHDLGMGFPAINRGHEHPQKNNHKAPHHHKNHHR